MFNGGAEFQMTQQTGYCNSPKTNGQNMDGKQRIVTDEFPRREKELHSTLTLYILTKM